VLRALAGRLVSLFDSLERFAKSLGDVEVVTRDRY
jgi:hypothetical protein